MQKIEDIHKLIKDREEILEILNLFSIDILKIEKKDTAYVVYMGGVNKILFQQNKLEVEEKLKEEFKEVNFIFK